MPWDLGTHEENPRLIEPFGKKGTSCVDRFLWGTQTTMYTCVCVPGLRVRAIWLSCLLSLGGVSLTIPTNRSKRAQTQGSPDKMRLFLVACLCEKGPVASKRHKPNSEHELESYPLFASKNRLRLENKTKQKAEPTALPSIRQLGNGTVPRNPSSSPARPQTPQVRTQVSQKPRGQSISQNLHCGHTGSSVSFSFDAQRSTNAPTYSKPVAWHCILQDSLSGLISGLRAASPQLKIGPSCPCCKRPILEYSTNQTTNRQSQGPADFDTEQGPLH